ncbi:hypothetical protein SAMN05216489_00588 [Streptomyces sp. 3213]|uniref:hypothetical protein n=1 Tax=Streptomyces sp. 3213.3 TaxID=1855348 RepID=UPI0008945169|nr:hypothetical protein [Streptomyces sp. 3213.3]SEC38162.1 hypothetical protein SAMN05216489_00588 [Streptomyces sp. 3213] [Streptomyces sp. 3213.3]
MTVASFASLSDPGPVRRPGETGVDGPAPPLTTRHFERTGLRRSEDGTAGPEHHNTLTASCDHRSPTP